MDQKQFASMGGKARARKLSRKRRSEIARQGGKAKAQATRPVRVTAPLKKD